MDGLIERRRSNKSKYIGTVSHLLLTGAIIVLSKTY